MGVTNDLDRRRKEHGKRFIVFQMSVLLIGPELACYKLESWLRPTSGIGWNNAPGGFKGGGKANRGRKYTKFSSKQLAYWEKLRGRTQSAEQVEKRVAPLRGRIVHKNSLRLKAEWLEGKRSPGMLGKRHSEETKEKMSAAQLKRTDGGVTLGFKGRKHSEETKAKLRIARLKQACPRTGKLHSEASKQLMRLHSRPFIRDAKTGRITG